MISTNLLFYMKRRKVRILIIVMIILLMAIFSVRNIYSFMRLSDMLSESAVLTITEYIIGIFCSAQFVMYFIIPISFSILVADLIKGDFDENVTQFILIRKPKRSNYVMDKFKQIFVLAIIYTLVMLVIAFIVALISNVSFVGDRYHYLFLAAPEKNILTIFIPIVAIFVLGLLFIGIMTLTISIYAKNAGIAIGIVILIGFVHNIFFVIGNNTVLAWFPFSQYIAGHYSSHAPFGLNVSYFNAAFACTYMIIGICFLLAVIVYKLKKAEI